MDTYLLLLLTKKQSKKQMKIPVHFRLIIPYLFIIGLISVWSCKEKITPSPTPTPVTKSSAKEITKFSFAALSPTVDATTTTAIETYKYDANDSLLFCHFDNIFFDLFEHFKNSKYVFLTGYKSVTDSILLIF